MTEFHAIYKSLAPKKIRVAVFNDVGNLPDLLIKTSEGRIESKSRYPEKI